MIGLERQLDPDAYSETRYAAPSWDEYYLEREWRKWLGELEIEPKAPTRPFREVLQALV